MDEPRAAEKSHYQMRNPARAERCKYPRGTWHDCPHCGKKFRNPNALKMHANENHNKEIS